ncbi:MAG: lipoate--protein ligase family protein [Candidatus Omnitrophota bacterium]
MEYIKISPDTSEKNIAFDEHLLNEAEQGRQGACFRFWEIPNYTVVLGRGCSIENDVCLDNCIKDNIEIIQRISGGGTVLLGIGCLNYSLVLPYTMNKSLASIKGSYKYILGNLVNSFNKKGISLTYNPVSDLAFNNRKVSGNAQARRKKYLLHHGTFLYDFDIEKISRYLKEPKKAPEYRDNRPHRDFVCNLPLSYQEIKEIIRDCFA